MSSGKELWDAAQQESGKGGVRSLHAMRFYALAKMLAEAETAWLSGQEQVAAEQLRTLQVHCDKMIAALAPSLPSKPTLVSAA